MIAGEVSGAVVQDAIADAYCWQLIGAFLGETIYSGLHLQVSDGRASVHRNGLHLATWQSTAADARAELHDRVGWTVFLQELWGRYDWDGSRFYQSMSYYRIGFLCRTWRSSHGGGFSASRDPTRNTGSDVKSAELCRLTEPPPTI